MITRPRIVFAALAGLVAVQVAGPATSPPATSEPGSSRPQSSEPGSSGPQSTRPGSSGTDTGQDECVAFDAPPPLEETRARRDRLVELLRRGLPSGRRGAFYLHGADEDDEHEFRQDSSFYYLTGLNSPSASLALFFDGTTSAERLYLPPADADQELWLGPTLGAGRIDPSSGLPDERRRQAVETSGFRGEGHSGVGHEEATARDLTDWLGSRGTLFLAEPAPESGPLLPAPGSLPPGAAEKLRRAESAHEALTALRLVKSPWEIARIRRAAEITCQAHVAALDLLRPGIPEYALEAVIEHAFTSVGARYAAFPAIVGSGPNSCILHYYRNGRTIRDDELVLIDIGAEYGRYAADVTRTLPSSGRFTAGQREVHDAVLRAQAAGIALAKPGATITEIDGKVREVLREHGLDGYVAHGCCHFVGLDVHDLGRGDVAFRPGMVLTVEPGVYIPEREIGVRIEDTLLITEDGNEVLSACAPKAAADIEARMAASAPRDPPGDDLSRAAPASPRP